ncbi:hypothetical protein F6R83_20820 [Citrobacter amalonaticus]|nr:hypothetical protein [Citrobacter amalonaticus]
MRIGSPKGDLSFIMWLAAFTHDSKSMVESTENHHSPGALYFLSAKKKDDRRENKNSTLLSWGANVWGAVFDDRKIAPLWAVVPRSDEYQKFTFSPSIALVSL